MLALSVQKRVEQLEYAFQTLDRMPPRIGLPSAGPPAFLGTPFSNSTMTWAGKASRLTKSALTIGCASAATRVAWRSPCRGIG